MRPNSTMLSGRISVSMGQPRANLGLLTKPAYYRKYDIMRKKAERGMEMQLKLHMVTIEDLVPKGHFLRDHSRLCANLQCGVE